MNQNDPTGMWKNTFEKTRPAQDYTKFSEELHQHTLARASFISGLERFGIQKDKELRNVDETAFKQWARFATYKRRATSGLEWHVPQYVITDLVSSLIAEQLLVHTPPQDGKFITQCWHTLTGGAFFFRPGRKVAITSYDLYTNGMIHAGYLHIYVPRPFPHIRRYIYDARNISDIASTNSDLYWAIVAKHEGA